MVRQLLLSFLAMGLITACPALAQNSGDDLQAFEFDYDRQIEAPTLEIPPSATPQANGGAPIAAPKRQTAAPSKDAAPAPLPPTVPPKAAASASPGNGSTGAATKDGVITIIGEPDPPTVIVTSDEDLITDLFGPLAGQSEEVILTPPGSPQTTKVPAGPGEVRVEKSRPVKSAKPKAAPKAKAKTVQAKAVPVGQATAARAPGRSVRNVANWPDDADLRRWAMATVNWSRVSPVAAWSEPLAIVDGRPLYAIDKAPYPGPVRRTAVSAGEGDDGYQP